MTDDELDKWIESVISTYKPTKGEMAAGRALSDKLDEVGMKFMGCGIQVGKSRIRAMEITAIAFAMSLIALQCAIQDEREGKPLIDPESDDLSLRRSQDDRSHGREEH